MDPILKFSVNNQRIYREDNFHAVAGSKNYLTASFSFLTPEWEGKTKTAIFHADKPYSVVLVNDACEVPWEFTAEPGDKYISVFSGDLITANKAKVEVWESGYKEGETPEPPTPSAYEQFVSLVEEIGDKATTSARQAEQSAVSASDSSDRAVAAAEVAVQSSEKASKSASNAGISETNAKKSENAGGTAASEIIADREQIKTNKRDIDELKSDLSAVNNSTDAPVPVGKIWTSADNGAGWADSQVGGEFVKLNDIVINEDVSSVDLTSSDIGSAYNVTCFEVEFYIPAGSANGGIRIDAYSKGGNRTIIDGAAIKTSQTVSQFLFGQVSGIPICTVIINRALDHFDTSQYAEIDLIKSENPYQEILIRATTTGCKIPAGSRIVVRGVTI